MIRRGFYENNINCFNSFSNACYFIWCAGCYRASTIEGVSSDPSEESPDSGDPCVAVTCLYGQMTGNSQNECNAAVKAFKSIKATKKHGIFNPTKTLKKRTNFLNGCPSADPDIVKQILKKFGKLKSF